MHYFQWHIGDYLSHTAHLTALEDLAYRRLLDMYYDTEKPIPNDNPLVSRRLRMGIDEVKTVLNEFFVLGENGWENARADEEIAAYHKFLDKQKANGKLGGKPKKTQIKPTANPPVTQNEPKITLTTNQLPLPTNHKEIPSLSESSIPTQKSAKSSIPDCPFDEIIDSYESALPNLPSVTRSLFRSGVNGKATAQRWAWVMTATHEKGPRKGERLAVNRSDGVDWFARFFAYAASSDFLTGATGKFTGCSLGWLMTKSNFEKVLAGNYHMEKIA